MRLTNCKSENAFDANRRAGDLIIVQSAAVRMFYSLLGMICTGGFAVGITRIRVPRYLGQIFIPDGRNDRKVRSRREGISFESRRARSSIKGAGRLLINSEFRIADLFSSKDGLRSGIADDCQQVRGESGPLIQRIKRDAAPRAGRLFRKPRAVSFRASQLCNRAKLPLSSRRYRRFCEFRVIIRRGDLPLSPLSVYLLGV